MRLIRSALGVLLAVTFGAWAGIGFGADAPKADQTAPMVTPSEHWFILSSTGEEVSGGYLHIAIKESGDPAAPVRVAYEFRIATPNEGVLIGKQEGLCLNDEWFSPVKSVSSFGTGEGAESATATFARPDPKSTAGKLVVTRPNNGNIENDLKERTVMFFTPLEIVTHLSFENTASVKFAVIEGFDTWWIDDGEISYVGKEKLNIKGKELQLHKFIQKIGERNKPDSYWLNDNHEVVRAEIQSGVLTPATEEEARKALLAHQPDK